MTTHATRASDWIVRKASWREAAALLAAAWLVPVLVHLVPWSGPRPLGVYVLPVFWTTFVAVYFYGAVPGLLVGLVTPGLNLLLTGLPLAGATGLMSLEVAGFAVGAALLVKHRPGWRVSAPLAYVAAKALVIVLALALPLSGDSGNPLRHFARSMQNGAAGLAVLTAINALLVAFCPKTKAGGK